MAYQCQTGRNGPPVQRQPTQQQHGPLNGNAGVCIDLDQHQCSYHDGKAFLACGCGLPVVGSTGLDSHTHLPLLSGQLDGVPVQSRTCIHFGWTPGYKEDDRPNTD